MEPQVNQQAQGQPQRVSDPNQVGILLLTIADRINESKDALTGDIRDFMTRVKELNALYAEEVRKNQLLTQQISDLMNTKPQTEGPKLTGEPSTDGAL